MHINALECMAGFFVIQSFCKSIKQTQVQLRMDNTTAVAYINNMGGSQSRVCNQIAKDTWEWCLQRGIWLSACHIPGKLNTIADAKSHIFDDLTEWSLDVAIFDRIVSTWGIPAVDLFASRELTLP
jgi:hypothetical protein